MADQAYKCNFECTFLLNNKAHVIEENYIKSVIISNMYEQYTIPVIYLSLKLPSDLYSLIMKNEKMGQFIFTMKVKNVYTEMALSKNSINGKFTYIPSSSNLNYMEELDNQDTKNNSYKELYVSLMSMDLLNKSKTSYNGIFGEIDTSTLMYKALEGLKDVVVQAPKYNTQYDTEVIPALNSRKKMLQYLFNQSPFYDTNFIFFMDFDKSYLVDMTGEATAATDNQLEHVIFNVSKITNADAFIQGMDKSNGAYIVDINPANIQVTPNKGQDKVANQIVNVSEDGVVDYSNLEINNNLGSKAKQTFKRGQNSTLLKNIMQANSVFIEMKKDYIDGSVFTPNKKFSIENYPEYSQYNGEYTLAYRREVITNDNGSFKPIVYVGLRKIGNIEEIGTGDSSEGTSRLHQSNYSYSSNPDYSGDVQAKASGPNTKTKVVSRGNGTDSVSISYYSSYSRKVDTTFAGPVIKKEARSPLDSLKRTFEFK